MTGGNKCAALLHKEIALTPNEPDASNDRNALKRWVGLFTAIDSASSEFFLRPSP
jgi:hypothetical protein